MFVDRKLMSLLGLLVIVVAVLTGCAEPQVIEKEVTVPPEVIEKEVTVQPEVVEKEVTVEVPVEVTAEPQPAPGRGPARDNIVVAGSVDLTSLDPLVLFSRWEISMLFHVIQGLTFRGPDMSVEPLLATEWERLPDDLTWEVKLREGVKFSNGETFNANTVKNSIEHMLALQDAGTHIGMATVSIGSAGIESVDIVDDYTVHIVTDAPKALMPIWMFKLPMLSEEYLAASDAERSLKAIGTGPYTVVEHVRDSHLKLQRNPDYWGPAPEVEEIIFRIIPEISTQIAELETGAVDIVIALPPDQAELLLDVPGVRVETIEGGRRVWIGITCQGGHPALEDKRVRQALNYAMDFDAINEGLLMGRGERMTYVFNHPYANTDLDPYTYDPEKAKALMAEAGYPDGLELSGIMCPDGKWVKDYEIAQVIKAQLEEVGITFTEGLVVYEWGVYRDKMMAYDTPDLFMNASGGEFELQAEAADLTFTSHSDFYRWNNPEYEALWEELGGTLDEDRRMEIGLEMQEIIYDDAPLMFVYMQLDVYGASDRIDWVPRMDEEIFLWDVSIVK
jgi:peptide/nickel transport system substrate-binding protein